MQQKSAHSQSFRIFLIFLRSSSQTFTLQFFVSQIFGSLNSFVPGGTKGHTYLKKPAKKAAGLFKDV